MSGCLKRLSLVCGLVLLLLLASPPAACDSAVFKRHEHEISKTEEVAATGCIHDELGEGSVLAVPQSNKPRTVDGRRLRSSGSCSAAYENIRIKVNMSMLEDARFTCLQTGRVMIF